MAATPTPPPATGWAKWLRLIAIAASSLLVIVVTPFLVFSEASIKGLLDSWLNDCLIVFEMDDDLPNRVHVRGYLSGKAAPGNLPITFAAHEGLINRVDFLSGVDTASNRNLALHPLANEACPGNLCRDLGLVPSSPKLTIDLTDVSPAFAYRFAVEFDKPATQKNLAVFIQYDKGLSGGVCRVEGANLFNFLARAGKWTKFFLLALLFLVTTVIIGYLTSRKRSE